MQTGNTDTLDRGPVSLVNMEKASVNDWSGQNHLGSRKEPMRPWNSLKEKKEDRIKDIIV